LSSEVADLHDAQLQDGPRHLRSPVALAAWMLDHDTDSYYKISRAFLDGQPAGQLTRESMSTTSRSIG
jgi:hypothetical protein